ncbi:family 43 glycosylhydrolase [Chitinophaga sp. 212800010-3]|uniref:family 43 glycosylhydrolase n=1 Tax=unclassified Chitinophaga TaxID=2619133 RepID=UPI002DF0A380|nr:F5/8 type C domain-containing protein [Chitinophaga sp. 212800010-3]
MYKRCFLALAVLLPGLSVNGQQTAGTFCNPLNLNYRFSRGGTHFREAADPVIHLFKGHYFLYASKSGGYWYSNDLLQWTFRPSVTLPVEDYAPTVETMHDTVFFIASNGTPRIYFNPDPLKDDWKVYNPHFPIGMTDPAFFRDDNGRFYFYYGCSATKPIMGVELDTSNLLNPADTPRVLITHHFADHGWEEHGEHNNNGKDGWNEGSWMNKHNGKYYLQYAAPGTEFKVYGDGVYVADHPLGPFRYMPNSPFSYKPGGFINGAGHGCTFKDKYGNYWHVATMTISVRNMFERRLGLFPAFFDKEGALHCITAFGDYPLKMPTRKMDFEKESLFTGWMLLSYNRPVTASSSLPGHDPALASDEDARTWWSAASGDRGEWLQMDLQQLANVQAIQVNFADEGAAPGAGQPVKPYRYQVKGSADGIHWHMLLDQSGNNADVTHDYSVLPLVTKVRYIRINNVQVPDGRFSVSDLRIFGKGTGEKPAVVNSFTVKRDTSDSRRASLEWTPASRSAGYVVWFGTEENKCYNSVMVYGRHDLQLNGLNKDVPYYFRIDAFNENGITRGIKIVAH